MKTILKLFLVVVVSAAVMTACVDHDWDLSKVTTDGIVVADTLVAPLGYIKLTAEYFTNGAVTGEEISVDPTVDDTFSYEMNTSLDEAIANALMSTGGALTILTTFENQTDAAFDVTTEFVSDADGTVLLPLCSVAANSTQTTETDVTIDDFKLMVGADRISAHLKRTDSGVITVSESDFVKVSFAIRKIGGIKLGSLFNGGEE